MSETSPSRASKLLKVLDLKQIEENLYQGQNETENGSRLFGGQVLAQASAAAYRTVDKVHLHSLPRLFFAAGTRRFALCCTRSNVCEMADPLRCVEW
jgi:acyl-CoA thioesterase